MKATSTARLTATRAGTDPEKKHAAPIIAQQSMITEAACMSFLPTAGRCKSQTAAIAASAWSPAVLRLFALAMK
jgi:hypothetical protein